MSGPPVVCAKCGATRASGAYCPECGSPLMAQAAGPQSGWSTPTAKPRRSGVGLLARLLLVVGVLFVIGAVMGGSRSGGSGGTSTPVPARNSYADEYGGNPGVYREIAAETDCGVLQASFDQAYENNEAAEPGTPAHRASLGFMLASGDRMEALGVGVLLEWAT